MLPHNGPIYAPVSPTANGWVYPISPTVRPVLPSNDVMDPFWQNRLAPSPGSSSSGLFIEPRDPRYSDTRREVTLKPPPAKGQVVEPDAKSLDKYADIFVPKYLRDIQTQHHHFLALAPFPVYPPQNYCQILYPQPLLDRIHRSTSPNLLSYPPLDTLPSEPLRPEGYRLHWNTLIAWELDQLARDKQQVILWQTPVSIAEWDSATFSILVPGVRENHPYLEPGDLLHLREVDVVAKLGTGVAMEGRIATIRKRDGIVHFICPPLKERIQSYKKRIPGRPLDQRGLPTFTPEDNMNIHFNISFLTSPSSTLTMNTAIIAVANILHRDPVVAHRWLFPEPHHLTAVDLTLLSRSLLSRWLPEQWCDSGLNDEQKSAVVFASTYQSPVPFIIKGPPGTGKTRTVVEMVHQILRSRPHAHILVCAPSNPATDTLAIRLAKLLTPPQLFRMNDAKRTFAEVPPVLLPFCHVDQNHFAIPPLDTLLSYKVIVTSCMDASILMKARCVNSFFGILEDLTLNALHPTRGRTVQPHWTHLIIDEAAQGSEPELLVPISVVLPFVPPGPMPSDSPPVEIPQLVLCGDPNQLGPLITSDKARAHELNVSLLERLLERPIYARYTRNRGADIPPGLPIPFVHLVKNYRSHPTILMPPSAMFYDDSLEPCATANGLVSWSGLPNPNVPVMFIGSDSLDDCIDERTTWFNKGEIDHVVSTVKSLLADGLSEPVLKVEEIGVMAPWREQVWKLRERLRADGLSGVDVGTVEDYQGRETRVVILSCVRSRSRFLVDDGKMGMGLIFERKRMNVAITRAMELLVVIGNAKVLKVDPYWKSFLQFAVRNKLYVGPELELEMDGNYISRLESTMMESFTQVRLDEEDEGVLLAGGIAREVLRDGVEPFLTEMPWTSDGHA